MKTINMKRVQFFAFSALAVLLTLLAAPGANAADFDRYCYSTADYDRDGDGYADLRGLDPQDRSFGVNGDVCPNNTVSKSGDCDDARASVHPYGSELGFNSIDDNCKDKTDEPIFFYSAAGVMNTTTSFRMLTYLNRASTLAAAQAGTLYADIKYAKLSNSANPSTITKRRITSFGDNFAYARIDLTGLSAGTVYRAYVTFFRREVNGNFTQLGSSSNYYYSMTDSATAKVHTRFQLVLKGFKELWDSQEGRVGYRGTIAADGTRYGANLAEAWCSEFYAWVTDDWVDGIEGIAGTAGMRDFFEDYDSFYSASEIPDRAAPGDYLYLDTDKDGCVNHSAMFLAYDTSVVPAQVWSLEGNSGNRVAVNSRVADWNNAVPVFLNLGYITNSMLD